MPVEARAVRDGALAARAAPRDAGRPAGTEQEPLLLYDGACGLCTRSIQLVLRLTPGGGVRFAPLQGTTAAALVERHRLDRVMRGNELESLVLIRDPGGRHERALLYSDAVLGLAATMGRGWRALALVGRLVPRWVRDAGYRLIARNRHRLFPPPDACKIPTPAERRRFLP